MPNWAVGDLKIRGKAEDLKVFINDIKDSVTGNSYSVRLPGFRRSFVNKNVIEEAEIQIDDGKDIIVLENVEHAWSLMLDIDVPLLEKLSSKYHLDLKTTLWERGMEFKEDVEIINGRCTLFEAIEYDDWRWESEHPTVGG